MQANRFISTAAKVLVLLLAIGLLYHYRHANPPPPAPVGGGDNDEDDVKYSPVVPVSVGQVTRATLHEYVSGYGTVEAAPANGKEPPAGTAIRVTTPALVSEVHCIEGQRVEKGQLLFTLDDRHVQAAIAQAKAALKTNEQIYALAQKSDDSPAIARQWLLCAERDRDQAKNDLEAAEAQLRLLQIMSPIDGVVAELAIRPGEVADPTTNAAMIVDMDRLVVAANLPGTVIGRVKLGQEVRVSVAGKTLTPPSSGKPGEGAVAKTLPATLPAAINGKVIFIDPIIDPKNGLGTVDVSLPPDAGLRLGDFAEARIVTDVHADCLAVPATSIVRDANGNPGVCVAVRDFKKSFRHAVKVGLTEGDQVEVESPGLNAGDWVVTTGAAALPEQASIDVVKPRE